MGGGPFTETLLFVHNEEEPKHITDPIRAQFPYIDLVYYRFTSPNDVPNSLWQRATILMTIFVLPPKQEFAPRLKWIQLASAGVDHIVNNPFYKDTDISITTASGIHTPAISEWALMTSLILSKNYNIMHNNQQEHKWDSNSVGLSRRRDWHERTVGIAGYGSIGRQVARVFAAMGCRIHAFTASPHSTPDSRQDHGYIIPGTGDPDGKLPNEWYSGKAKSDLHKFLSSGLDLLFISVPLTPATRGIFGAEEFDVLYRGSLDKAKQNPTLRMRSDVDLPEGEGCIVSNISRGAVIDQPALIEAFKAGKLQGATLDVTDPEPLPKSSELWDLPNAIITPHLSGNFATYADRAFDVLTENLRRRGLGEKMLNLVDRSRGY